MTLEVPPGGGQGDGSMGHTAAGDREGRVAPVRGTTAMTEYLTTKEERLCFGSEFVGAVPLGREVMAASKGGGSWLQTGSREE